MQLSLFSTTHTFAESLAVSHAASDLPLWETIYRKAFPTFLSMNDHRQDGDHQRNGIDRSVILANSKVLLIDEKFRGKNKNGTVYEDILLEYLSVKERNIPGWVCKPLMCDYIAYAIGPLGKCYLLPIPQLQKAWKENGDAWIDQYKPKEAQNVGYKTVSVGVPVSVLFKALGAALRVEFDPVEADA